jgi:putative nucleotidyltransferase with HDIG domain
MTANSQDSMHPAKMAIGRIREWLLRLSPFYKERQALLARIALQDERIEALTALLGSDRRRTAQIGLLSDIIQNLKTVLDQPVAAQLVVNAIRRAFDCPLVAVLRLDAEHKEFVTLAMAGPARSVVPPSYRQSVNRGLIGRVWRLRMTQVANDTRRDPDYIGFTGQTFLSELVVPLIQHGAIQGVLVLDHYNQGAFSNTDIATIETVAEQLVDAWERSEYHQRLTEFIQAGITLSTTQDTQAATEQIAAIVQKTLDARFALVALLDQDGTPTRLATSGNAPGLANVLCKAPQKDPLIRAAMNARQILRLRDFRQSPLASHLKADQASLKSMMAFPIRLQDLSIGAILAFGKRGQPSFTENDEALASLIAAQAAAAVEGTWLYQELRNTLSTTTLLYQLSIRVMLSENLSRATEAIAETALKLGNASVGGIVLFNPEGEIEAQVEVDASGIESGTSHPFALIQQAMQTGQTIIISDDRFSSKVCIPLQTHRRTYGALWLDIPEGRWYNSRYAANLQTLTNQATVALERLILLTETRHQTIQLETAYRDLEASYDQTLNALISALDARDRETEGHSARVGKIASRLGQELGLSAHQIKVLERGALLHDIGKIGISDTILHKTGPLNNQEWEIMRTHPEIGARIVERVPFLSETLEIIRFHQERWDGSGYPLGLAGKDIPLLARIFAVADAFDALISDRPYRKGIAEAEALDYIRSQAGILFDPQVVEVFEKLLKSGELDEIAAQS